METATLLLVDDRPENLFVLEQVIQEHLPGCGVVAANSAEEGLAIAARRPFDGALIDVQMPGIDGIELCRRLKNGAATRHWPVILITAHCSVPELRVHGLEAGAVDFVSRPIDNVELVAKIRVILRLKRAEDELRRVNAHLEDLVAARTEALKQSESRYCRMAQSAQAADRAKSAFLANMSHEIRTPMTAILGYAHLICETADDPLIVESAQVIQRNGNHLICVINDILDLSKIEAGKHDPDLQSVSPRQLVGEVVDTMRVQAAAKDLPLTLEIGDSVPETIHTDPTRLRQILVNLLGNAIKFTDTGSVGIVVERDRNQSGKPCLRLDVTDTGIGISDEQAESLFLPFSQGDESFSRRFGGSGLGLAISRRLARLLGGDITLSSEPGKGSTFRATVALVPLDSVEEPAPSAPLSQPPSNGPLTKLDARILLAEDGLDNQRLISLLLKRAGAEVVVVDDGRKAMESALASISESTAAGERFDIILMDMQMPVMDGYEATRQLRAGGYTGPVIALTAHAMAEDRQKCLDAGCNDYVSKPVDRQRLLRTVSQWAGGPTSPGRPVPMGHGLGN